MCHPFRLCHLFAYHPWYRGARCRHRVLTCGITELGILTIVIAVSVAELGRVAPLITELFTSPGPVIG